jgi:RNA polymerase sporulation-specific sigma factor
MAGRANDATCAIRMLCGTKPLSPRDEQRLFCRLRKLARRSQEAVVIRNRIAVSNLRLVVSVARRFRRPERPLEDLVSEAALPLLRCVESFDVSRNTRFSTYATRSLMNFFAKTARQAHRETQRIKTCDVVDWAINAERPDAPVARMIRDEDLSRLRNRLARLPERDRQLMTARFGLTADGRPLSFRELGALQGLSKERVRVMTHEAMARLQQSFSECRAP